MDMSTTRAHMTRAVLEGVAFGLRDSLEIVLDMGIPINEIRLGGGGARSPLWRKIMADIFHHPVAEINTAQGGALGAAILAAVGAGVYPDVETGSRQMVHVVNTVLPNEKNAQIYNAVYEQYKALYKSLADWFKSKVGK
jgi:xylulokinase